MIVLGCHGGRRVGVALWNDGAIVASFSTAGLTGPHADENVIHAIIAQAIDAAAIDPKAIELVVTTHRAGEKETRRDFELPGRRCPAVLLDGRVARAAQVLHRSRFVEAGVLSLGGELDANGGVTAIGRHGRLTDLRLVRANPDLAWMAIATTLGIDCLDGDELLVELAGFGQPRYYDHLLHYLGGLMEALDIPDPADVWRDELDTVRSDSPRDHWIFPDKPGVSYGIADLKPLVPQREWSNQPARDLAASILALTEDSVSHLAGEFRLRAGIDRLCLAGRLFRIPSVVRAVRERAGCSEIFTGEEENALAIGLALHGAQTLTVGAGRSNSG